MSMVTTLAAVAVSFWAAGAPAHDPADGAPAEVQDVTLGAGWAVAQAQAALAGANAEPARPATTEAQAQTSATAEADPAATTAARPSAPRPDVRPFAHHTDLDDRIREARRARALHIGAAFAVQGAMVIYGITRAIETARENEIVRDEPPRSQFKPAHPR